MIRIYTDGAAQGNPGPGGYGTILKFNQHTKELADGFRLTTNNRMELLAVIAGLEAIKSLGIPVTIYSDSKYVVDAVEKGWIWGWQKRSLQKKQMPIYGNATFHYIINTNQNLYGLRAMRAIRKMNAATNWL
jgi:ribonuclease HI